MKKGISHSCSYVDLWAIIEGQVEPKPSRSISAEEEHDETGDKRIRHALRRAERDTQQPTLAVQLPSAEKTRAHSNGEGKTGHLRASSGHLSGHPESSQETRACGASAHSELAVATHERVHTETLRSEGTHNRLRPSRRSSFSEGISPRRSSNGDTKSHEQRSRSREDDTRSHEQRSRSREDDTKSHEQRSRSREDDTKSHEQRSRSREDDTKSHEQRSRSREDDTKSDEQRSRSREDGTASRRSSYTATKPHEQRPREGASRRSSHTSINLHDQRSREEGSLSRADSGTNLHDQRPLSHSGPGVNLHDQRPLHRSGSDTNLHDQRLLHRSGSDTNLHQSDPNMNYHEQRPREGGRMSRRSSDTSQIRRSSDAIIKLNDQASSRTDPNMNHHEQRPREGGRMSRRSSDTTSHIRRSSDTIIKLNDQASSRSCHPRGFQSKPAESRGSSEHVRHHSSSPSADKSHDIHSHRPEVSRRPRAVANQSPTNNDEAQSPSIAPLRHLSRANSTRHIKERLPLPRHESSRSLDDELGEIREDKPACLQQLAIAPMKNLKLVNQQHRANVPRRIESALQPVHELKRASSEGNPYLDY